MVCLAGGLGFACVATDQDDEDAGFRGDVTRGPEAWIPAPSDAYCEILVEGKGIKELETDYLPHVITCENGGANLEALKAQAIAARSVAYYYIANRGSVCDSQGCQVYTCGAEPSALAYQAVNETSGQYLNYDGVLTYAFYVAGDPDTSPPACVGTPNVGTENWVTYNQGNFGTDVEQTELGWVFNPGEPGFGQNRGCMSQWGARCLENDNGQSYEQILRFYYGEDTNITQAQGPCILELGGDGDGDPTTGDGDGDPDTGDGDGDPSTGDGDGDPSTGDGDGDECVIGSLGCMCTMGGGCDPGLICVNGNCVPEAPSEEEGDGETSSGLSGGFQDDAFAEGDGCECSTRSGEQGAAGLLLLGLLGLARRRRG
jgi:MYXO-CTERM domain-containing protein